MALAAHNATQTLGGDEQRDRAARNGLLFAQNLLPKFAHTLHAAVTLPHALNPNRTLRQIRLACTRQELPVGASVRSPRRGRSARRRPAHVLVDERVPQHVRQSRPRGGRPAAAEKALALRRTPFTRFSPQFSRSSAAT